MHTVFDIVDLVKFSFICLFLFCIVKKIQSAHVKLSYTYKIDIQKTKCRQKCFQQ